MKRTAAKTVSSTSLADSADKHVFSSSKVKSKLRSGDLKIAMYGLGHVGSPLAAAWLRAGAYVIGFDKSPAVLANARQGRTHVPEPGVNEAFSRGIKTKHFLVYDNPVKAAHESFLKMICVPVLLTDGSFSADLSAIKQVASTIARGMKKGDIVSLNPSVPPGTSEDVILPILEKESGLTVEKDFFMLYNPERIYEGRAIEDIEERYPAVISGAGPRSLELGKALYSFIFKKGVIQLSSMRTAETEKLLEGIYRDVNIALANELAKFCERIGVDFWEAREAANSQPFSHIHRPGAGVGGACIPVYPHFVLHTADAMKIDCNITRLSRNVNDTMPAYCAQQAVSLLNAHSSDATIAVLGLAFRGGVSDTRLSPTYDVISELRKLRVGRIRVHDPLVKADARLEKEGIPVTQNLKQAIDGADLIMLVADHPEYRELSSKITGATPIYDGRGMLDRSKFRHGRIASIGRPRPQAG